LNEDWFQTTLPLFILSEPKLRFLFINTSVHYFDGQSRAKKELRKKGVSEKRIKELFDPSKYEPHHVEDQKTFQFVDRNAHKLFTHRGSASDIAAGRPPVFY